MEQTLATVLIVLVSSAAVFFAVFFVIKEFFTNEGNKRNTEAKTAAAEILIPAKMQAYERVILLLERIAPGSLIMRVHKNGITSRQLQAELVKNIRSEYEHNISQQVYISGPAWEMVKNAKEETIKIINIASTKVDDDASGIELSQKIFEVTGQLKKLPTDLAIEVIKKDFNSTF